MDFRHVGSTMRQDVSTTLTTRMLAGSAIGYLTSPVDDEAPLWFGSRHTMIAISGRRPGGAAAVHCS